MLNKVRLKTSFYISGYYIVSVRFNFLFHFNKFTLLSSQCLLTLRYILFYLKPLLICYLINAVRTARLVWITMDFSPGIEGPQGWSNKILKYIFRAQKVALRSYFSLQLSDSDLESGNMTLGRRNKLGRIQDTRRKVRNKLGRIQDTRGKVGYKTQGGR